MDFISVFSSVKPRVGRSFLVNKDKTNQDYVFSRTKQQFKDECDINRIVDMYPDVNSDEYQRRVSSIIGNNPDLYGDYDSQMDYATAVDVVNRAKEQFDTLPSILRERFAHDPFEFLSYVNNPSNREEATNLGLFEKVIPSTNIVPEKVVNTVIQPSNEAVTQSSQSFEPMP